jgi:hypothetical protein
LPTDAANYAAHAKGVTGGLAIKNEFQSTWVKFVIAKLAVRSREKIAI